MAVAFLFTPSAMTKEQYYRVLARLDEAGVREQPGRSLHVCFGSGDQMRILDIWDSEPALMASFAEAIVPILQDVGIDAGPPEIFPVERVIS